MSPKTAQNASWRQSLSLRGTRVPEALTSLGARALGGFVSCRLTGWSGQGDVCGQRGMSRAAPGRAVCRGYSQGASSSNKGGRGQGGFKVMVASRSRGNWKMHFKQSGEAAAGVPSGNHHSRTVRTTGRCFHLEFTDSVTLMEFERLLQPKRSIKHSSSVSRPTSLSWFISNRECGRQWAPQGFMC